MGHVVVDDVTIHLSKPTECRAPGPLMQAVSVWVHCCNKQQTFHLVAMLTVGEATRVGEAEGTRESVLSAQCC